MPVPWGITDPWEEEERPGRARGITTPGVPAPKTSILPPLGPTGPEYDALGHYRGYQTYWEPRETEGESKWYKVAAQLSPEDMAALFQWWDKGLEAEPPEPVKQRIVQSGLGWYDFRTHNPVGEFGYYADYLRNLYDSELRGAGYGAARPRISNKPGFGLLNY